MSFETKSFASPDQVMTFAAHGKADVVKLGDGVVRLATFEPDWRWSKDVAPVAGTDRCQNAHMAYVISGRHHVVMADGSEFEIGPGDVALIPPDHDAWTVGDETCVIVDFGGMRTQSESARFVFPIE